MSTPAKRNEIGVFVIGILIAVGLLVTILIWADVFANSRYSNGGSNQARALCIDLSGALVSNATIIVPTASKMFFVRNGTTGAFTLTLKTVAGTGVVVPQDGTVYLVYSDGINVVACSITGTINASTLNGQADTAFFRLGSTNVVAKGNSNTPALLTDAATVTMDVAAANVNKVILAGTPRTLAVTNAVAGAWFELYIKQDATGGRTLVFPGNFLFNAATTPTLSTAANATDLLYGRYDAVDAVWRCIFQNNFTTGTTVATTGIVISENEQDIDIYRRAGAPAGAVTVSVTVNAGVVVGASSTATPAMRFVGFAAGSIISVVNNGYIIGRGGDGGNGATSICFSADDDCLTSGTPGRNGGNAVELPTSGGTCIVTFNNASGHIWGGGGGGGGGGANSAYPSVSGSAGGGGGGGAGGGRGGHPGGASINGSAAIGGIGTEGGSGPAGTNGTGGAGAQRGGASSTGAGGAGGAYGANGVDGTTPASGVPAGVKGTAGKAVNGTSTCSFTFTSTGDVLGAVS
jgi:hypothetical protein